MTVNKMAPCRECGRETRVTVGGQPLCPQCDADITGLPLKEPDAKIDENARKIIETQRLFWECAEGIRVLPEENDPFDVDILEMLRLVSDMSDLQSRLRDLCRERNALLMGGGQS